ncbi:flap endonuclease 1-like isoform X2 [Rhinatrema bivittatum]|uniref:flap endonuclease 1-like isoform X2 n=1 Tax=Rhinatrema bivittatum TaxID=194408 RepID=UPI0011265A70|nr:flap endonuclease 1-like isoform X2 [Rhinatrema bivittatum]
MLRVSYPDVEVFSSLCLSVNKLHADRIIALDAPIVIYQFYKGMPDIINRHGENIGHLQGLFYRTVTLLENGIKPVFVFEGRPPELKQLMARRRAAAAAGTQKKDEDAVLGSSQNSKKVVKQDCETLLSFLGVPCIQAPSEGEATCAALVASGQVWGTATEDMDALPFGSTRLIRNLKADKNCQVDEYDLPLILEKLQLTHEQFVDLCILLGCDYSEKIRGLGPKKALKLLHEHGSIEQILQRIDLQKHPLPDFWHLQESRTLFLQPEVADANQVLLEWAEPNEEQLVHFLSHQKHMKEDRIRKRLGMMRERLQEAPKEKRQKRMGDYFPVKKSTARAKVSKPQKSSKERKRPKMAVRSRDGMTK